MLHTGIRRGELVTLTKIDVDLNRDVITVTGKGEKTRQVYLALEAQKAILGYLRIREDNNGALFATLDGRPITGNAIQCMLSDLGRHAGIKDVRVSAHTFRHTFAVNFLRAGGSLRHLQEVMGHASFDTTARSERYPKRSKRNGIKGHGRRETKEYFDLD